MDSRFFIGIVLCSILSSTYAGGSLLTFTTSPRAIQAGLTSTLTLRCSLLDSGAVTPSVKPPVTFLPFGGLVGRKKRDVTTYPTGSLKVVDEGSTEDTLTPKNINRRGAVQFVEQTTYHIRDILYLHIFRGGAGSSEHIASVSVDSEAKASAEQEAVGDVNVSGNISADGAAPGEQGYLEVSWRHPTSSQLGQYTCEVSTLTDYSRPVFFAKSLHVADSQPTIADLVEHIRQIKEDASLNNSTTNARMSTIEARVPQLESAFQAESQKNADLVEHIRQIKEDASLNNSTANARMSTIEARVAQLESAFQAESHKNAYLEVKIAHVGHIETGRLRSSIPSGSGNRYRDVRQVFKRPYSKIPQVVLGTTILDESIHNFDSMSIRFNVYVLSVDTKGFTARFNTWNHNTIQTWTVNWISVPAQI